MKKLIVFILAFLASSIWAVAQPTPIGSDTLWVKYIGGDAKAVKFSPDGQFVYAGVTGSRTIKLLASSGDIVSSYDSLNFSYDIDITKDGQFIVTGGINKDLIRLNTSTGNVAGVYKIPADIKNQFNMVDFWSVSISNDNKYVVSVILGVTQFHENLRKVLVWDFATCSIVKIIDDNWAQNVRFSPIGNIMVISHSEGKTKDGITIYNTDNWQINKELCCHNNIIHDIAFSPDGSLLASCGWDGFIKIWDLNTMGLKTEINSDNMNNTLEFIDNYTIIADGDITLDSYVKVWDINSKVLKGKIRTSLPEDISVFSPNGLAAIGLDGKILMFNYTKYVGVETQIDNNISITPNPFNNILSFNINQPNSDNIKIELFDNDSNSIAVVFNSYITTSPFIFNYNTETLPSSVYYCKISIGNSTSTHKLIKVR